MDSKQSKKSKSSIPTSSSKKPTSKSKLPSKESKKKDESTKTPKPKVKSPSPEPINEYEDDFESYESDFEDDVSEIKPVRKELPKAVVASSPELKHEEHVEELVESEEEAYNVSDSVLLTRVNQAKLSLNEPLTRNATTTLYRNNDVRPATSANRVFTFENKAVPNTEALMQSVNIYERLRSDGRLSHNFIQSVDVAPNRVSELYNSLIENTTSSQRYTQTGEDALDNCAQTTPREFNDKANQFPTIFVKNEKTSEMRPLKDIGNFSTAERFLKFVGISGRTMMSLVSLDKPAENVHFPLRSNVEFSVGFVQFTIEELTKKCKPISIEMSCDSDPKILIGFYIEESDKKQLIDKSILLEYNFENLEQPINVYLTSDEITDFSYSSDGKSLIFAGQRSGNCLLWDLLNRNMKTELENIPQIELGKTFHPQFPAYSTAYILSERKKHAFLYQPDQSIIQTKALKTRDSNAQHQFLSLNSGGVATIWATTRDQFTANDDLGLDFSSLVRLMKISSNVCATMAGFGCAGQVALSMDANSSDFIVGMSQEGVIRICRNRQSEQRLRRYNLTNDPNYDQSQLSANTVCFSPHEQDYFAVGASNGSLLLFNINNSTPLAEIRLKESRGYRVNQLTNLAWSHSHSQIIYALYDSKYFAIWDLSSLTNIEPEIVDLSQKFNASNILKMFSWSAINNTTYIGFTLTSGSILIHELHRTSVPNTSLEKLFH